MGGGIITTRVVLEQIYPVGVSNYCFRARSVFRACIKLQKSCDYSKQGLWQGSKEKFTLKKKTLLIIYSPMSCKISMSFILQSKRN